MIFDFFPYLAEFRGRLQEISKMKNTEVTSGPDIKIYNLAMAVGRFGIGGFMPLRGMKSASKRGCHREEVQQGRQFSLEPRRMVDQGHVERGAVVIHGNERDEVKSYYQYISDAREQAAKARIEREAGSLAAHLPLPETDVMQRSFAPVGVVNVPIGFANSEDVTSGFYRKVLPNGTSLPNKSELWPDSFEPGLRMGQHGQSYERAQSQAYSHNEYIDASQLMHMSAGRASGVPEFDIGQALEEYFFQQSRLPPAGTTAFDPRLTPLWAGLKLPG